MPFPKPFALVTWGGYFAQSDNLDEWSNTLKFASPLGTSSFGSLLSDDGARRIYEVLGEWWPNPDLGIRQNAYLKWAKVNLVGTDGRYVSSIDSNFYEWENEKGGSTPTTHPYQIAACATLNTLQSRGLAHRGRMFLPTGVPFTAANAGMAPTATAAMASGVAGMIQALNGLFRSEGNAAACVISNTREGACNLITGVSIGNRFDVQRRRDNAERETYSLASPINLQAPAGSGSGEAQPVGDIG